MTEVKNEKEKLKKSFEQEDIILNKIQDNLTKIKESALNAPDVLEQVKKQESDKKVAISGSLGSSI